MNESSKSYLYGNLRLSAAEWRANLDNTDTAETLQSMQDIDKNAEWLRAYLQENDTPTEELGLPGREYNELKRSTPWETCLHPIRIFLLDAAVILERKPPSECAAW